MLDQYSHLLTPRAIENSLKKQKIRLRDSLPDNLKALKKKHTALLDLVSLAIYGLRYGDLRKHFTNGNIDVRKFYPALLEAIKDPSLIKLVAKKIPRYVENLNRYFAGFSGAYESTEAIINSLGLSDYLNPELYRLVPSIDIKEWKPAGPKEYPEVLLVSEGCIDGKLVKIHALRIYSSNLDYPADEPQWISSECEVAWKTLEELEVYCNANSDKSSFPKPLELTNQMADFEKKWLGTHGVLNGVGRYITTPIKGCHYLLCGCIQDIPAQKPLPHVVLTEDLFDHYPRESVNGLPNKLLFNIRKDHKVISTIKLEVIPIKPTTPLLAKFDGDQEWLENILNSHYDSARPYIKDFHGYRVFYLSNLSDIDIDHIDDLPDPVPQNKKDAHIWIETADEYKSYELLLAVKNRKGVFTRDNRMFVLLSHTGVEFEKSGDNASSWPVDIKFRSYSTSTDSRISMFPSTITSSKYGLIIEVNNTLPDILNLIDQQKGNNLLKQMCLYKFRPLVPKETCDFHKNAEMQLSIFREELESLPDDAVITLQNSDIFFSELAKSGQLWEAMFGYDFQNENDRD